jgi:hypothetical protein
MQKISFTEFGVGPPHRKKKSIECEKDIENTHKEKLSIE